MIFSEEELRDAKVRVVKAAPKQPAPEPIVTVPAKPEPSVEIKALTDAVIKAIGEKGKVPDITVQAPAPHITPTEWELTVTSRDADRRIRTMTIKAVEST